MIIFDDGPRVPIAEVKQLWDKISFSRGRSPEAIALALQNSQLLIHAWDTSRLVGTARVITDGVYYATIWDVIVDPEYHDQGIGRRLVERATKPFIGRGFAFIALFYAPGTEEFYQKLGFVPQPRGMIFSEPPIHAEKKKR